MVSLSTWNIFRKNYRGNNVIMVCFPSVCENPLGIEGGLHNITVSSVRGVGYEPWRGRLNSAGIWRPYTNQIYEFLQVRFDQVMTVIGIATQGDSGPCGRVRRFWLYHSLDGMRFELYNDPIMGNVSRTACLFNNNFNLHHPFPFPEKRETGYGIRRFCPIANLFSYHLCEFKP